MHRESTQSTNDDRTMSSPTFEDLLDVSVFMNLQVASLKETLTTDSALMIDLLWTKQSTLRFTDRINNM